MAGMGAANAICKEYIFAWFRKHIPDWEPLQVLFDCTTCLSFWTTLVIALCCGYGWNSIIIGLSASIAAHIMEVWEGK